MLFHGWFSTLCIYISKIQLVGANLLAEKKREAYGQLAVVSSPIKICTYKLNLGLFLKIENGF